MNLSKASFDVANPIVAVRVMCGLFYVPHILYKLNGFENSVAFFGKAGFHPAAVWLVLALVMESACAIGLTFGIFTKYLGVVSAGVMATAVYAVFKTKGLGWMWNGGGIEYLAFWGVASLAVALHAWKTESAASGAVAAPVGAAARPV
jgi:putative oxidoreductase